MTKNNFIDSLNFDLANEFAHMHFYLRSAIMVEGMHREELGEFFMEQAASEMNHVKQFSDMIVGLGGTPGTKVAMFPENFTTPRDILSYALTMENQVVENYAERMDQARLALTNGDAKWVEAFLENQIVDSRTDADNIKKMLK